MIRMYQYGAPPHGGIAPGIERLLMLFLGEASIREVVPFPKNQRCQDVMVNAPSEVAEEQLHELGIAIVQPQA
jgi:aspartyl-tRNA synthetase